MKHKELYTPGADRTGPPNIKNFDADVQAEYNKLKSNRSNITARLGRVKADIRQAEINIGGLVASGCDWSEYGEIWRDLQLEHDALTWGIRHVEGELSLVKGRNSWLRD